jgi:hypothetical protein
MDVVIPIIPDEQAAICKDGPSIHLCIGLLSNSWREYQHVRCSQSFHGQHVHIFGVNDWSGDSTQEIQPCTWNGAK